MEMKNNKLVSQKPIFFENNKTLKNKKMNLFSTLNSFENLFLKPENGGKISSENLRENHEEMGYL